MFQCNHAFHGDCDDKIAWDRQEQLGKVLIIITIIITNNNTISNNNKTMAMQLIALIG